MSLLQRIIYILLIALLVKSSAYGQSNKTIHKVITQQEGLLIDAINTMEFDDEGFLWMGGRILDVSPIILSNKKQCLQRFNGVSFHEVNFPEESGRVISVQNIYKRKDGKFYVHVSKQDGDGIFMFDPFTTHFEEITLPRTESFNPVASNVFSYNSKDYVLTQLDRNITLNILNEDLSLTILFSFTSEENKFRMDQSTRFIGFKDYCIIGDDNFPITILNWEGEILYRYSAESFSRDRVASLKKFWMDEIFVFEGVVYAFIKDYEELHYFDTEHKKFLLLDEPDAYLASEALKTFNDEKGNHIIATVNEDKLGFYKLDSNGISAIQTKKYDFDNVGRIEIASQRLDEDLWIGTNTRELHYFKFPTTKIKNFMEDKQLRAVTRLSESEFLVATEGSGWFTVNTTTGEEAPYMIYENGYELVPKSSRGFFWEGDFLWSNSFGNIVKVNTKNKEVTSYRHYPVTSIVAATDSTFVYTTHEYNLMEFNKNTFVHRPLLLTDTLMMYDLELQNNTVAVGTNKGLLTYDLVNKDTKFYNNPDELEDRFILMTDYHPDYGFLLGTRAGNLVAFHENSETFTTLYKDDLKAGIATVLFEEDTWWINTFNGVVAYDTKNKGKVRFSEKDGLSHNETNRYSALDTGNGFLVGAISGLNFFKPEELKPKKFSSNLRLLRLRSYNSKTKQVEDVLNGQELQKIKTIEIPAEYKELQLDFALDHNTANREHSFRYKLNDENWIDLKQEQSIRFPSLGAGTYDLDIEALDFSGNRIGPPLSFKINSKNFFHKTWWFYSILSLGGMGLVLYFLKQAQEKRKSQEIFSEKLLQSQEEERTRIAKDLHDSIGQQLTLIKRKAQDSDHGEISKMTHRALEEVRSISRNLYPSVLKQLGLSESIEQMVYDLDEQTDIFFTAEIDEIDSCFSEEGALNFYRFIQESITNILKHAQATSVSIQVKKEEGTIQVQIEDNGKGFIVSENLKNKSLGLKTIAERIRIMKGTLQISSKENKGTRIISEIPIS